MWDAGVLVFVEVKSRVVGCHPVSRYSLFDNITPEKKRRLRMLVEIYLRCFYRGSVVRPQVRLDLVGVELEAETFSTSRILYLRAAL